MFKLILKILLFIILTPLVIFFGMYIAAPDGSEFIRKNPTTTALIRQRTAEYQKANKNVSIKWQWMPISKISPNIIHAVILAEDARFYEHNGFDVEAIKFALEKNRQRQRYAIGGSTITQQLAKNLYLTTKKSIPRKVRELIIAFKMDRRLSKRRILEIYLNVIEFGRGIYGVEAASQHYFSKSAANLSIGEASRLIAILPSPRRHSPLDGSKFTERRQKRLLTWLFKTGHLDSTSYSHLSGDSAVMQIEITDTAGFNKFLQEIKEDSTNALIFQSHPFLDTVSQTTDSLQ
jgi:monofunctional biosynthetic peptidoglycan transglycosylase